MTLNPVRDFLEDAEAIKQVRTFMNSPAGRKYARALDGGLRICIVLQEDDAAYAGAVIKGFERCMKFQEDLLKPQQEHAKDDGPPSLATYQEPTKTR